MNTDTSTFFYILGALVAIISTQAAALVWVVKNVFSVVEKNTQVNDRVGSNLSDLNAAVSAHITVTDTRLSNYDKVFVLLSGVADKMAEISSIQKEILLIIDRRGKGA